jgi:hypothetical protein
MDPFDEESAPRAHPLSESNAPESGQPFRPLLDESTLELEPGDHRRVLAVEGIGVRGGEVLPVAERQPPWKRRRRPPAAHNEEEGR